MKILAESLFEYLRFTEKSDPVEDMGIGIDKQIAIWLLENNVIAKKDFTITRDHLINTYNTSNLSDLGLKEFPDFIKFGYVMGGFHCDHNELKSLKGTPNIVSGSFLASWNKLPNLIDGPKEVKGDYIVSHNELTSLDGLASVIHGFLSISNNKLKDLKGIPRVLGGNLYIHKNPIETLKYFPDEVDGDVYYTPSKVVYEESIRGRCKVSGNIINKQ